MKKFFLYFLLAFAVFSMLAFGYHASALTVTPTLYDLTGSRGQSIVKTIRLTNEQKTAQTYQPSVQNFIPDPTGSNAYYVGNQPESSLANWISVGTAKVTLKPSESLDVPFTISIPADAEPGGHYASIFWGVVPETSASSTGLIIKSQIATPKILLKVEGEVVEEGQIQGFGVRDGETKFQRLPVEFVTAISNAGNVHFRPQGQITIKNMFGRTVAVLPFNNLKDGGYVLPQSVREFGTKWERGSFTFGMYAATLSITYGSAGRVIESNAPVTFWVMPPGLVFIWFLAIIFVVILAVFLLRKAFPPLSKVRRGFKK